MNPKLVVRPIREDDFDAFLELATSTGGGLTNISTEPEAVRWRIEESIRSFDLRTEKTGSHRYLFLLENVERREVVGSCGIISKVGGFQPFYSYDIRKERFAFPPLEIDHEIETLSPRIDYNGPSEICCLFLRPEWRRGGLGRLLSLSRFHFMGEFEKRFDRKVIAELRGVVEDGSSPFWDSVARHFFQMEFRRADHASGSGDKEFIAQLLPKHPLYIPLLPEQARAVIGRPHRHAEPALKLLMAENFTYSGHVDIFDAGPIVEAEVEEIRTVRMRRKLNISEVAESLPEAEPMLLSNARIDFRACIGNVATRGAGEAVIDRQSAHLLNVEPGETVACSPLRPESAEGGTDR